MGYYANGSGTITVTKISDEIKDIVREAFDCDFTNGVREGTYDISVWSSDKYYDDIVYETLNKLNDITVDGSIQFIGEDDEIWRWFFNKSTKRWEDESGDVVYWSSIKPEEIPRDALERIINDLIKSSNPILVSNAVRKLYHEIQKMDDIEDLTHIGINNLIYEKIIPDLDEITKRKLAELSVEEYREALDSNDTISEIIQNTAEETLQYHLTEALPVVGSYCLSNTGSVNVYYADSNSVFAGINDNAPEWCEVIEIESEEEESSFGFKLGNMTIPFDKVM